MGKRGGRKRTQGQRYPSGRLKHTERPDSAAVEARMRLYGVPRQQARKQETGSAIGRALNNGDISQGQFDALDQYRIANEQYRRALDIKRQRSASDFSGAGGYDAIEGDDPDYVEWCNRQRSRFNELRRWALDATPFADMAIQAWVMEDKEAYRLLGELRLAANAIGRLLKLDSTA